MRAARLASPLYLGLLACLLQVGCAKPESEPIRSPPGSVPVNHAAHRAGDSVSIQEFKNRSVPGTIRMYGGMYPEWQVYTEDNQIRVRPFKDRDVVGDRPPFPLDARLAKFYSLRVQDGWLVGINSGEFGAELKWFSSDGMQSYKVSDDQVCGFLRSDSGIFAIQGLAHLSISKGSVVKLARKGNRWTSAEFAPLPAAPETAAFDSRGRMVVVTTSGVTRIDLSGKFEQLIKDAPWAGLYANSIVLARDDVAYIGMRQAVVEASWKDKPVIRWYVQNGQPDRMAGAHQLTSEINGQPFEYQYLESPASQPEVRFFGLRSPGVKRVVYVVCGAGGMVANFDYVKDELARRISELKAEQEFSILFFADGPPKELRIDDKAGLFAASPGNVKASKEWLSKQIAESHGPRTSADSAIARAFGLLAGQAGVIFILTNGQLSRDSDVQIADLNKQKLTRVNTIGFLTPTADGERQLKKIASDNGGEYRFVGESELGQ